MGWFFTTFYLVLNHMSLQIAPELAPYHPQLWIGLLALIGSLVTMMQYSYPFRAQQNILILGLFAAILLSEAVHGWLGEMAMAASIYGTSFAAFFFCVANNRRLTQLRLLVILLTLVGLYMSVNGLLAYHWGIAAEVFIDRWPPIGDGDSVGPVIERIRGMGLLRDPNDLSQFLLVCLSFTWLAWRRRSFFRNFLLVVLPTGIMLYAIYRTQSRGALIGLATLVFIPLRRRMGTLAAGIAGGVLVVAILASGFLAQRQGSLSSSDESALGRIIAWRNGIAMVKSEPLFGVGFGHFSDRNEEEGNLTAHNSFVLCLAELGLVGYFLWLSLILCTLFDLQGIANSIPRDPPSAALQRWATAVRMALTVFMVTSWFLSRSYIITLYVLIGMAVSLGRIARSTTGRDYETKPGRWFPVTCYTVVGTIGLIICMVRLHFS